MTWNDGHSTRTRRRNLETVMRIEPAVVVPVSGGFCFVGEHNWLNAFLFPIPRERFVADLRRLEPRVDARLVDPGDVLELSVGGGVVLHEGALPFAHSEARDTARIVYDPKPQRFPRSPIRTPMGTSPIDSNSARTGSSGVRYQMGLVFPDDTERRFDLDFAADSPRLSEACAGVCVPTSCTGSRLRP